MRRLHTGSYASGFSLRRMLLFISAIMMAYFVQITVFSSTASAADATWNNGSLVYQSQTYTKFDQAYPGAGLRDIAGSQVYRYVDTAATPPKAHFIYFPAGVDVTQTASAQYMNYNYKTGPPEIYDSPSATINVAIAAAAPGGSGTGAGPSTKSCSNDFLSGVGWIICPFSNMLANLVDSIYRVLTSFFDVRPLTADPNNGIFMLWNIIRNIANIAFVIVFLIIVYSQITSLGISKYGVQKALPRLLIGAILVNVSYWICAIGVDLSNISGNALNGILVGIRESIGPADVTIKWSDLMLFLLSGGGGTVAFLGFSAATGGSMAAGFFIALGGLISVAFSLIVAVAILAARQAIIVVFVALSPLAFVAYLLPSTEKLFSRWSKTFISMLVMFPMFALLFGGAQLAGTAIIDSADGNLILAIIGLITQIIPLALTPLLMKLSGGILSTVASFTNNSKKGLVDRAKNWTQDMADYNKDRALGSKANWWMGARRTAQAFDRQKRTRDIHRKRYQNQAEMRAMGNRKYQDAETMANTTEKDKATLQARNEIRTINNSAYRAAEASSKTAEKDKEAAQSGLDRDVLRNRGYRTADRGARDADAYKKEAEANIQSAYDKYVRTDAVRLKQELKIEASAVIAKSESDKLAKLKAEIVAEGDKSSYLKTMYTGPQLTSALNTARRIQRTSEEIAYSGMAKKMAEKQHQDNIADALMNNKRQVDGVKIREYAGGVQGANGANAALAYAVATKRKQFGDSVNEMNELIKNFNPSSEQLQDLVTKGSAVVGKDSHGHKFEFNPANVYAMEAAVEKQMATGTVDMVDQIIEQSGSRLAEYRTTISDSLAKAGHTGRSIYQGGALINEVAKGTITNHTDLIAFVQKAIADGKFSADKLASLDKAALERFREAAKTTAIDPALTVKLAKGVVNLKAKAETALTDDRIRTNVMDNSAPVLEDIKNI